MSTFPNAMRTLPVVFAIACAGPAAAASALTLTANQMPASYHPKSRDEHIVEALEQEWLNHEHDRAVLVRVLADDFVHPVAAGVFLDKKQHVEWAVSHPEPPDRVLRFEAFNVRMFGDVAIVSGIVLNTNASGGDAQRTIFTDVFAKRDNLWRAVNAQENAIAAGQ